MKEIKREKYHMFLSDFTLRQLKQTIGMEIREFRSDGFKFLDCYTDGYLQSGCSMNSPIRFTLIRNQFIMVWKIKSIPIGDTMLGYSMYGLDFSLIQNDLQHKVKRSSEFVEEIRTDASACFRPIVGVIKSIDVFGINNQIVRDDEEYLRPNDPIYHIDANLDLLITFNTSNECKIAITGHDRSEGASISVFNKNAFTQYNEWIESKRNQWGEKLFNLKLTIS